MIHHKVIPEKYSTTDQYRSGDQFDDCLRDKRGERNDTTIP
jgi:hypothetical protein